MITATMKELKLFVTKDSSEWYAAENLKHAIEMFERDTGLNCQEEGIQFEEYSKDWVEIYEEDGVSKEKIDLKKYLKEVEPGLLWSTDW